MAGARRKMSNKKAGEKPAGKDRILDAAEQLFARHGFYGVSVRDITEAAGVDVALVNYHFGSKRELFTAVFQRRAELLNPERLTGRGDARGHRQFVHLPDARAVGTGWSGMEELFRPGRAGQ